MSQNVEITIFKLQVEAHWSQFWKFEIPLHVHTALPYEKPQNLTFAVPQMLQTAPASDRHHGAVAPGGRLPHFQQHQPQHMQQHPHHQQQRFHHQQQNNMNINFSVICKSTFEKK